MRQTFSLIGIIVLIATQFTAAAEVTTSRPAAQPNIVVIVADDLGYGGLSCQGGDLQTPAIDALAKSGTRFTNGYVSCPVCSPTRAGLNTGRYQQRFGHELNPGPEGNASDDFGLPLTEVTIANQLMAAGYTTGMSGKWHLGHVKDRMPLSRGFDEFFGFLSGAHSYLESRFGTKGSIMRGYEQVDEKEYLTDAFTREGVAFINNHAKDDRPFYLYLPYNAVHTPMQTIEKYMQRFPNIKDERRRKHAAMLAALDDGVGAVMNTLRKNGLEEKTLVFFFSDNGGPTKSNTSSNKPLRGYKGQVLEGGIRIPFMVSWKGHLPAGKVDDRPVIQLDIMPTAVAAAGGTMPSDRPIDGVNLLPYLTGQETKAPHDKLFWRFGSQAAVRIGDWKLTRHEGKPGEDQPAPQVEQKARNKKADAEKDDDDDDGAAGPEGIGPAGSVHLYNLAKDIHEDHDLAAENPEKVKELTAALDAWESQLVKPLWRGKAKFQSGDNSNSDDDKPAKGKKKGKKAKKNQ